MFVKKLLKNRQHYTINNFVNKCRFFENQELYDSERFPGRKEITIQKGCVGCMRSSPVASMLGLIMILFGIGAFSGGFIIFWKEIENVLKTKLQVEPIMYGVVLSVVIYAILCYILAALSSGHNRKRFFEGSKKAKIGRCFTLFNIICLMLNAFIWILVSCIAAYCFIVTGFISNRNSSSVDLSYYILINRTKSTNEFQIKNMLLSVSFTFGGSLAIVIGFMQLLCCCAMNYVRLSEERYYDNNSITQDKSDQVLSAF